MIIPPVEIRHHLQPLSRLYGIVVNFRNMLFDCNILKQKRFDIPIICVGNITAGGTGKTPHIEYLIRLLSPTFKVAVLSRGYKRKSKGFLIVETSSKVSDVGDEPLQIKQKFPDILVVVDENRVRAIEKILSIERSDPPDLVLLDDGFQHRYVRPSLSIVLVDSNRPPFEDRLLPAGLLREPIRELHRASIVIVTKCHPEIKPIHFRIFSEGLALFPYQELYFTSLNYEELKPLFPEVNNSSLATKGRRYRHLFLITGIASPQPLVAKLKDKTDNLQTKFFPDHHNFTKTDIWEICRMIRSVDDNNKIVITTEKDAVRFRQLSNIPEDLKNILYYIPVKVKFTESAKQLSFNNKIIKHVRNYQTNSRLSKK